MRCHRLILAAALLVAVPLTPLGASEDPQLVVSAEWVRSKIEAGDPKLVVLHVGRDGTYAEGHVPGAVSLSRIEFSHPDSHSDENLILELPEPEVFQAALRERGVDDDSTIVVYWAGEWVTAASRLVFTLDWAGLGARTALMDGGLTAWKAAGFETASEPSVREAGNVTVRPRQIVVDADWVREHGASEGYQLVDARAGAFFDGVRADRGLEGHIEGAGSIPWTSLIDEETMKLHPRPRLKELLTAAGVHPGDTVVGYCHIGLYTTLALLTARLFGHEVLLYDGAIDDWSRRGLPVVKGP